MKKLLLTALCAISTAAFAGPGPDDAKAMLGKAVAAVKADRDIALAQFSRGDFSRAGLTKEEDLFPFCIRLHDAKLIASNTLGATMGTDIRTLLSGSVNTGRQVYDALMKPEGVISQVNYLWPKPGTTAPLLPKVSLVTRVSSDLGCGVGFYRFFGASAPATAVFGLAGGEGAA